MNKAVMVLTASTVVLTGTTLYYAYQLGELRSMDAPVAAPVTPATPAKAAVPAAAAPATGNREPTADNAPAPDANARATPASSGAPDEALAREKARYSEQAREYLSHYDDPAQRQKMRASFIESRRQRARKLATSLGITDEQFETLIELQADNRLDNQARRARCVLDPACVVPAPASEELEERRRAATALVGDKKIAQLFSQDRREPETSMVEKMQSRLPPELRLKPLEQEALIDAVGHEIREILNELRAGGKEVSMYSGYGVVPYAKGIPTLEENMEIARKAERRLDDCAATLLNGKQLETFNTLQADGVVKFREFMRQQISLRDAGYKGA